MNLDQALEHLSREAFELYLNKSVAVLEHVPDPLDFYRDFVAANRPVIIRNSLKEWPALGKWNAEYLRSKLGDKEVTVTITPNGYADAVADGHFVLPDEKQCMMAEFLDKLSNPPPDRVHYIQKQNSNLTEEFPELIADSAKEMTWATKAFGCSPDAVNFWMGDGRAITSMHKDPYENIYCVVSGYKDMILHPPTDLPWIPHGQYPQARYQEIDGHYKIIPESSDTIPWVSIDPLNPDFHTYPEYRKATQIHCRIYEGEVLYLPSLWFHHVRQSHACIAVNYWHDMRYDIKYNYYQLLSNLVQNRA